MAKKKKFVSKNEFRYNNETEHPTYLGYYKLNLKIAEVGELDSTKTNYY